jgi:hypothetical protein
MLDLRLNSPPEDKTVITNSGMVSFTEELLRPEYYVQSYLGVDLSNLNISGLVTDLNIDLKGGGINAHAVFTLLEFPFPDENFTINQRTYVFVPKSDPFSHVDQIHIGDSLEETYINIFRVVNASGISSEDFYTGQTPNEDVYIPFVEWPMIFMSRTSGTEGNNITANWNGTGKFGFFGKLLTNGSGPDVDYTNKFVLPWNGLVYNAGPLQYDQYGYNWYGEVYMTNSGIVVKDTNGDNTIFSVSGLRFDGMTEINEFLEVSGLSVLNLQNSNIDSSGEMDLLWINLNLLHGPLTFSKAYPTLQSGESAYPYAAAYDDFETDQGWIYTADAFRQHNLTDWSQFSAEGNYCAYLGYDYANSGVGTMTRIFPLAPNSNFILEFFSSHGYHDYTQNYEEDPANIRVKIYDYYERLVLPS